MTIKMHWLKIQLASGKSATQDITFQGGIGFHPQTQNLELHTKPKEYLLTVSQKRRHLKGHTIGFHSQTHTK